MTDVVFDLMEIHRNARDIGWYNVAETYEAVLPKERQQTDSAIYCGVLYGLAVQLKPGVIVEIGCQYGLSTRMFLATGATVHSYDIDPECAKLPMTVDQHHRWRFHLGRSQDMEPLECDLLYVDGDHSYEAVCSDMARHGPKVRDGGLVVLDDYYKTWPGKVRWIDERWKMLDPIIIGPTAVVRVTSEKRHWFKEPLGL